MNPQGKENALKNLDLALDILREKPAIPKKRWKKAVTALLAFAAMHLEREYLV